MRTANRSRIDSRQGHCMPSDRYREVFRAGEGNYAWPGSFARKPSMHNITASGVSYSRHAANGNIDFYKFRGTYYLVDHGDWYRADSWRGPFLSVSASSVPREVLRVPTTYRMYWMAPVQD